MELLIPEVWDVYLFLVHSFFNNVSYLVGFEVMSISGATVFLAIQIIVFSLMFHS